jgi:HrpA-like RNA helicase
MHSSLALVHSLLRFSCSVRLAKMLIIGYKSRALSLSLIAAIVACVAERNPFLRNESQADNEVKQSSADNEDSDADDPEDDDDDAGLLPSLTLI